LQKSVTKKTKDSVGEQSDVGKNVAQIKKQKGILNPSDAFGFFKMPTNSLVNRDTQQQRQLSRAHVDELKVKYYI
jgi:hypothetical protein